MKKLFMIAMAAAFSMAMVAPGFAQSTGGTMDKKADEKMEKKADKKMDKKAEKAEKKMDKKADKKAANPCAAKAEKK